jgi:hypothetical protein
MRGAWMEALIALDIVLALWALHGWLPIVLGWL